MKLILTLVHCVVCLPAAPLENSMPLPQTSSAEVPQPETQTRSRHESMDDFAGSLGHGPDTEGSRRAMMRNRGRANSNGKSMRSDGSSHGGLLWGLLPAAFKRTGGKSQLPTKSSNGSKSSFEGPSEGGDVEEGGISGAIPLRRSKSSIGQL